MVQGNDIQIAGGASSRPPSSLSGIASLIIALLAALVVGFALRFGVLANGTGHPGTYNLAFQVFGELFFTFAAASSIGTVLGLLALRHRGQGRWAAVVGLVVNLLIVAVAVATLILPDSHSYS